ncbi:hypothetical protein GUITHDRAFT_123014, partial [Guillardia theta CCMP2712]
SSKYVHVVEFGARCHRARTNVSNDENTRKNVYKAYYVMTMVEDICREQGNWFPYTGGKGVRRRCMDGDGTEKETFSKARSVEHVQFVPE